MLNNNPDADTFLKIKAGPIHDPRCFMKVDTPFSPIQSRVREARNKAMTTGNHASAAQFCQYTLW